MLRSLLTFTREDLNVPANYESYLVVEKYTGASFLLEEQIMISAELKPDVLYPNWGLPSLQQTGYRTYMPSFFMYKNFMYTTSEIDKNFGQIKTVLKMKLWIQVVGYLLGGLILLGIIAYYAFCYYRSRKQKMKKEDSNSALFLNHQDSASGRGELEEVR